MNPVSKCPYCRHRLSIVPLSQYLPECRYEGWVFWCRRCGRYFAAPTDEQVRQLTQRQTGAMPA